MAQMTGADAAALDQLAGRFEQAAQQMESMSQAVRAELRSSPWSGGDADGFRTDWDTLHAKTMHAAATFLRDGAEGLRRNAQQQRDASGSDGGSGSSGSGTAGGGGASDSDDTGEGDEQEDNDESIEDPRLDALKALLKAMGIGAGTIDSIMDNVIGLIAEGALSWDTIAFIAKNEEMLTVLAKTVGKTVDMAGLVVDFMVDYASHPELDMDSRLIHATTESLLKFGADKGFEWVGEKLGAFLGTGVCPGIGTAGGAVLGKLVGMGAGVGFGWADDKWSITENGADGVVAAYEFAKEHDFNTASMAADLGGQAVDAVADGAVDLAQGAVDGVQDAANWVDEHKPSWMPF